MSDLPVTDVDPVAIEVRSSAVRWCATSRASIYRMPSLLTGLFLTCCGLTRLLIEFVREPGAVPRPRLRRSIFPWIRWWSCTGISERLIVRFVGSLVLMISASIMPPGAFAHGSDHPADLRNARNQFTHLMRPRPAPLVPILAQDGSRLDLGRFRGKLVLLNFWATWCAPCLYELPALDRLQALLGNDAFAVVALSIDEGDIGGPISFVERLGLKHLTVYQDFTGRAQDALPLYGLPISYLVDGDGLVLGYIVGAVEWDSPEALGFLRHYLRAGATASPPG